MDTVIVTREESIKIVRFNRPKKKNAIDLNMYLKITDIINTVAKDDEISLLVLTGTGDFYSSGNDFKAVSEYPAEVNMVDVLKNFIHAFITFPKTLVAIVNGPAIGIAATTLALCDLVFASETAYFLTPFTELAITAEGCSTLTFPRLIGERKAIEMLQYSQKLSAQEALRCGFVNYLYKPEELQNKVWDMIVKVSQFPLQSVTITKSLIRKNRQEDLEKTNEIEMAELQKIWSSKSKL